MAIVLDHWVKEGTYAKMTPASGKAFGTTGCQCCVGVLAQLQDKSFFCGHMDHATLAKKKAPFKSKVDGLLNLIGPAVQVVKIHCITEPTMFESKWSVEAIVDKYGSKCTKQTDSKSKGVYVKDGQVSFIKNTDEVTTPTGKQAYKGKWTV